MRKSASRSKRSLRSVAQHIRLQLEVLEQRLALAITPVTVTITHVDEIEDPDPFPLQGDGDYYAMVRIHDFPTETSGIRTGEHFDPGWTFTKNVDLSLGTIQIAIGIRDEDDDTDDTIDINPVDNVTDIILTLDLLTGRYTGDVNFPANSTQGDSDFEEDSIEGGEAGKIFFRIDVPFTDVDTDGDGLPDRWETQGLDTNNDGTIDLQLNSNPNHKDLFVEVDAMNGLGPKALSPITAASNAGPIVVTAVGHGLTTGTRITVQGVTGNTAANGTFTVTRVDNDRFQLDGSIGNGAYISGGTWLLADLVGTGLATNTVLDLVIDSFRKAPVSNPDGQPGITLRIQLDTLNLPVQAWDTNLDADSLGPYGEDLNANGTLDLGPDGVGGTGDAGDEDGNNNGILDDGDADDQGGYAFYRILKQAQFGTAAQRSDPNATQILEAKRLTYRYNVFANYRVDSRGAGRGVNTGSSGIAWSSSDFIVSLGNWTTPGGAPDEQAGTFMHELGHTLGIDHGGSELLTATLSKSSAVVMGLASTSQLFPGMPVSGAGIDNQTTITSIDSATQVTLNKSATRSGPSVLNFGDGINYKPNYHSLMNYTWQLPNTRIPESWQLDFSRSVFPDLNENNGLNESAGIGGHAGHRVLVGPAPSRVANESGPVDWSRGNADGDGISNNDTGVAADITQIRAADAASPGQLLKGHNDWLNIIYQIGIGGLTDGVSPDFEPEQEFSLEDHLNLSGILRFKMPVGDGANAVTLRRAGDFLEIRDDATAALLVRQRVDETLVAEVIGADNENDRLTVDFAGGNPIPAQGLSFGGGAASIDSLVLAGSLPATPIYTPDASGSPDRGSLALGASVIRFSGLEFVRPVAPDSTGVQLSALTINENDEVTLTGQFLDPGTLSTHSVSVDWGDGVIDAPVSLIVGSRSFSITRRYLDDNPSGTAADLNNIVVTIRDNDNLTDSGAASITVNNIDPVFSSLGSDAPSSEPAAEGVAMNLSGSFTDVGTLDTHSVTVAWGDGAVTPATVTEAGGMGTFTASHAFQFGGIYQVLVTLRDDDTGKAVRTKTIFVTGVGVHEVGGFTSLQVVGSKHADDVHINQQADGTITVHATFLADRKRVLPLADLDIIQVALLGGNDKATIAGNVNLPAVIDGGEGNDQLNGSNAASVIIGGHGNDMGNGGSGNDIVIGGRGADRLVANGGDDILIAGFTAYDSGADDDKIANDLALLRLLDEWKSSRTYAERRTNVRDGSGPKLAGSGFSLKSAFTVFDDLEVDRLTGAAGQDWFFFDALRDVLMDRQAEEELN